LLVGLQPPPINKAIDDGGNKRNLTVRKLHHRAGLKTTRDSGPVIFMRRLRTLQKCMLWPIIARTMDQISLA
jgi:hypothetical protein